jgi:hypothetical protein
MEVGSICRTDDEAIFVDHRTGTLMIFHASRIVLGTTNGLQNLRKKERSSQYSLQTSTVAMMYMVAIWTLCSKLVQIVG